MFGVVAVSAAIWVSTWWLLSQTHSLHDPAKATARLDAIKTGLSVGAGTGGAVALLLAMRRQWLSERDQAHREHVDQQHQIHADRVAAATEHDAAERRVTDLYVKAVDQLGSDQPVVRLGGLYALERLAQDNPGHRQTVVNVICAYLRMPFPRQPATADESGTAQSDSDKANVWRQELQVRETVQRILADHLSPKAQDESYSARFWDEMRLDLSGATLIGFHLNHCRVYSAVFSGAIFVDYAGFVETTFVGHVWFDGATFLGEERNDGRAEAAFFINVTVTGDAVLHRMTFHGDAVFAKTQFNQDAQFIGTTFNDRAFFNNAVFTGGAKFDDVTFAGEIEIEGARVDEPDPPQHRWPDGWTVHASTDGTGTITTGR